LRKGCKARGRKKMEEGRLERREDGGRMPKEKEGRGI
jgi:hypothetical protein